MEKELEPFVGSPLLHDPIEAVLVDLQRDSVNGTVMPYSRANCVFRMTVFVPYVIISGRTRMKMPFGHCKMRFGSPLACFWTNKTLGNGGM